jgi:hypothetical protein
MGLSMGRLIYDTKTQDLIDQVEHGTLSEASQQMLKDAYSIVKNTEDNIFIALDLNDISYHKDFSVMVISKAFKDGSIEVIDTISEVEYRAYFTNVTPILKEILDKLKEGTLSEKFKDIGIEIKEGNKFKRLKDILEELSEKFQEK